MELRGQLSIDLAQNLGVALVFPEAVKRLTLALQPEPDHRRLFACPIVSRWRAVHTYLQHRHFIYMQQMGNIEITAASPQSIIGHQSHETCLMQDITYQIQG